MSLMEGTDRIRACTNIRGCSGHPLASNSELEQVCSDVCEADGGLRWKTAKNIEYEMKAYEEVV